MYVFVVLSIAFMLAVGWWFYCSRWVCTYKADNLAAAVLRPLGRLVGGWALIGLGVIIALATKIIGG